MKKFLSLVMALIMVMSLVTVASAADYTDAADIDKAEAVDVMSAVGVFQGSAGKFNPKGVLNRAEAAKLIAYLDLGEDVAEALPAVQSFSDVPATHWAAKFVSYCADEGYINGVGNGMFDPAGKLTGYQFGKLLLCVLGYDYKLEGFTGANWSIAVAKLMQANDINKDVKAAPSAELTREDAAQYCLNALQATTVKYDDKGTTITVGGVDIVTGAKDATPVPGGEGLFEAATVELAEKLYEDDLIKSTTTDVFCRPSTTWKYGKTEIGNYANTAKKVWTTKMDKDDVTDALKGYVISASGDYKINADTKLAAGGTVTVGRTSTNGAITLNSAKSLAEQIADLTGNGKRVEVFTKKDAVTKIVVTSYSVAEVTKVVTDKDGNVTYTLKDGTTFTRKDYADEEKADAIVNASELKKDDVVTYAQVNKTVDGRAVVYTYPTTSVTGVVTRVKANDYVIVDGTTYPLATGVSVPVSGDKQELTIDQYGVVVDYDAVEEDSSKAYVAKVWNKTGSYNTTETWVQIVTTEGEVIEKQLAPKNGQAVSEYGIYDYYVTSKDTVSLLTDADDVVRTFAGNFDSTAKTRTIGPDTYYFAKDVEFINVKDNGADIKVTTSAGMQKVETANVYAVVDDYDIVTVFVPAAAKGAVDKADLLFLASYDIVDYALDKDNKQARVYEFNKDAENTVEAMVLNSEPALKSGVFFTYSVDATTGRYDLDLADNQYTVAYDAVKTSIKAEKYIEAGGVLFELAKDCSFIDLTENGFAALSDIVDFVEANSTEQFVLSFVYNSDNEITVLYIIEADDCTATTIN